MSDPVTNVEIEDVLSSIRRLVSDGDKARTRDPAPAEATAPAPQPEPESGPESNENTDTSDRLVLTPAFLVVDSGNDVAEPDVATDEEPADTLGEVDSDDDWYEEEWPEEAADHAEADESTPQADDIVEDMAASEPFALTEMVFEEVEDTPQDLVETASSTDRSGLVATIAELEAAISSGDDDFEPDGSEVMGETIQWPGSVVRDISTVPEAEVSDDAPQETAEPNNVDEEDVTAQFAHRPVADVAQSLDPVAETDAVLLEDAKADDTTIDKTQVDEIQDAQADEYGDDDLDDLLDAATAGLDQDALKALVSDVVREELTGPLGERITRNVRKLVRREIYRILSSQEFD